MNSPVAVIRFLQDSGSLSRALDLCQGLQDISTSTRILIKPNLVFWDHDFPFPPYGILTTTRMVKELILTLKERGYQKITIGEGTLKFPQVDLSTHTVYQRLGYSQFAKAYGVNLIDFFDEPFVTVEGDGIRMEIAKSAMEAEFLITLPALKTHSQTKVSLGSKNLKGTLDMKTRRLFHSPEVSLEHGIAHLARLLKPGLNIIDGLYGLEQGPHVFGQARRLDAIIASRDFVAADLAACHLIGIDPGGVGHLSELARGMNLNTDQGSLNLVGESLDQLRKPLRWDWEWSEDGSRPAFFKDLGVDDVKIPKYDNTFCTGCSLYMNPLLVMLTSMWKKGKKSKGFEFLTGKAMQSEGGTERTFLLGRCMIEVNRNNPRIRQAVPIPGCPPSLNDLVKAFQENGVGIDLSDYVRFRAHLMERYQSKPQFDPGDFFHRP